MTRLMMMTSAAALALTAAPAMAQKQAHADGHVEGHHPSESHAEHMMEHRAEHAEARIRVDGEGTIDTVDLTPRHDYDYIDWTPAGNLVAYDVDGDGWIAYRLGDESYVVRDKDGDGYVLRTDVNASADTEIDVITVEYDPSQLEPMTGYFDTAFLVESETGERMRAENVSISEGGPRSLIADSDDLVVSTDDGTFVVEDGETYTLAEADVSQAWTAPVTYTFVEPVSATERRAAWQASSQQSAGKSPSTDWVVAPMLQVFRAMDSDDNMQVSYQEWGEWQADDGFEASRFSEFDQDGDRTLGWSEYRTSVISMYGNEVSGS
ncbi:hypothetical protein [Maricaulis sp. CAU 1757]